jgi:hypothetical protein
MVGQVILFSLLTVLVGLASLSPASAPAVTDPENLRSLTSTLEAELNEWLIAWRVVQPRLRLDQFKRGGTGTLGHPWRAVTIDLSQEHPGFPVFIFSPDRRWFVDVLGGLTMAKRNGYVEVGFQPDSWVYLVDQKKSRIRQILMSGTAGGFHEAVWLSNDIFVVAGYGEAQPKQGCPGGYTWAPTLYLINLPRDSVTGYRGPESCGAVRSEYVLQRIQQKIPNVRF